MKNKIAGMVRYGSKPVAKRLLTLVKSDPGQIFEFP